MPFLLPALVALGCDAITLTLSRLQPSDPLYKNNEVECKWVYNIYYLEPISALRIIILLLPLLFHSYTGTAIKFPKLYQTFYYGTILVFILHMVCLCFFNPGSIEALLPLEKVYDGSFSMRHLHELRRVWLMLLLSLLADLCHIFLFGHVRSTAPHEDWLRRRQKGPSAYYTVRQVNSSIQSVDGTGTSNISGISSYMEPSNAHKSSSVNEFMYQIQGRLTQAKSDWAIRLGDFTSRVSLANAARSKHSLGNPLAPLTPFRVLCLLFGHEDVLDNGKLEAAYKIDDGGSLTFFIPQLLSFLLHGALYSSPQLEEWILNICRRNVHFAHRCYWFLRAWCLEVPVNSPPTPSIISRNNSDVALSSGGSLYLDEPYALADVSSSTARKSYDCGGSSRRGSGTKALNIRIQQNSYSKVDKFLPEERALIERLMLRVKECGEESAKVLEFGKSVGRSVSESGQVLYDDNDISTTTVTRTPFGSNALFELDTQQKSPSELASAVEAGMIPINPASGVPSVKHLDCISSARQYGFLPLDVNNSYLSSSHSLRSQSHSETDSFDRTPQFLDSLVYISDSLFAIPKSQRRDELRRQLCALECELLPSNSIYIPLKNVHHRVWRIVSEESIPLNTKERVPCIICMEVVDYSPVKRQVKTWNIARQGARRTASEVVSGSLGHSNNITSSNSSVASSDIFESNEGDILQHWRYAKRDPLRRVSIIDKVTSTVKETVKGPLDKVKNHLNHYKDLSVTDELQSLTLNDPDLEVNAIKMEKQGDTTSEQFAVVDDDSDDTSDFKSLSRASSSNSFISMGQWSSPHPSNLSNKNDRANVFASDKAGLAEIKKSLDVEHSRTLMYGSDEDDIKKKRNYSRNWNEPDSITSPESVVSVSSVQNKPPQVVFKESWKNKMERIRTQSAYGNHSGWRLLPILIKANDDLRQEQLAAQLIHSMAMILAREKVPVWLCPYEIIALTDRGGIIECVPDTISLDSLKKNDPTYTTLRRFFISHYGDETEELADAKANFVESLAAYSVVCFLLQLKDRHNGNILLDAQGHILHIDFGFFFLSSPGKNAGFESAPFKLTREFVDILDGPSSRLFRVYRELCIKTFIALRRHCMEIILLVEMLKAGNEELPCFRGRPDHAIQQLKERFRLDLNDRACREYVNSLIDSSIENWRTDWYDRYQRYFVGVL